MVTTASDAGTFQHLGPYAASELLVRSRMMSALLTSTKFQAHTWGSASQCLRLSLKINAFAIGTVFHHCSEHLTPRSD